MIYLRAEAHGGLPTVGSLPRCPPGQRSGAQPSPHSSRSWRGHGAHTPNAQPLEMPLLANPGCHSSQVDAAFLSCRQTSSSRTDSCPPQPPPANPSRGGELSLAFFSIYTPEGTTLDTQLKTSQGNKLEQRHFAVVFFQHNCQLARCGVLTNGFQPFHPY